MSSATAMGIGKTAAAAPAAAGEGPQVDGDGFLRALTAVASGPSRQDAGSEDVPLRDPATGDWTQAGLAALLSGVLPVAVPAGRAAGAAATVAVAGDVAAGAAGETSLAAGAPDRALHEGSSQPMQQENVDGILDGQAAALAMDEQIAPVGAARDALRQLSLVLAGAPRDSLAEIRPTPGAEPLQTSSTVHGNSQLTFPANVTTAAAGAEQALRAPVGSPRWAEELGSRLVMLSARGQHEGSLTLTPEHLGPLEVRITVSQNTANVWFGAQQADTRAALAEAMPRLRELFADAGLALGESGVSQQAPREDGADAVPWAASREAGAEEQAAPPEVRRMASALLDLYA
jgi:flagellar hook-length control protein FliK